ncbi:MAG: hypothetical protein E7204_02005 [Veillonella sp.]|uniref:beta strand repeat-containing protein n=1 Tax=Veillonella sp. TaxID=1926307 RepID=UPI0025D262E8|nr:hypothetical protein [Veillonella sp.]MBE6079611.1 hypothetical protein [Veillonella sp.]
MVDDGSTTYTIASTDTNTTLASGTISYNDKGTDGTITLTDSANNKVTVEGVKNTYLTEASLSGNTLTLTQNEGTPITVTGIATTAELAANKVKYFSVKSELSANQNNDGAKGTNSIAIGPNAKAEHENGIALGTNVLSGGKGSIVIGSDARVAQNITLDGSIVIGKGAEAFTGGGEQEALLGMDPTNWPNRGAGGYDNPKDTSRVATSIVIGTNASGRTGSIDIGDRVYKGTMGGREITDKNSSFHVNQTTLGTNTYNKGLFSTMMGSYSIATGGFDGSGRLNTGAYGAQNFGATVLGSLNSIRSNEKVSEIFGIPIGTSYQGIANTIVGLGNITDNSNGSLVFGAGNKITNSITDISMPTSGADSVDAMVDKLQDTIKKSSSGGATLAIGGGNTADYTRRSSIIGVNNTLTGTSSNISQNNALTGYNNTATNVDNVTVTGSNNTVKDTTTAVVIGDNRTLTGVNNNVILGSADSALETTVSDAVAVGRNANVTIEGGVALGANSVARTDKGVVGYDPSGRITDADSILGTNTQYQTLQTEVADAQTTVNDLTTQVASYQTAINQIVSMYPDNSYEQDAGYQGIKAALESTQSDLATAQANLDSKQSALAEAGKALYTWQSTAGSVSVGDVSKGITRQITDVAAGTADTDAVNVAQLKANKVTVVAGDNVTVTSTAADDGGTTYTVASKDTYTTGGTYDADSKTIKFTQNDTEKNYEVDLSSLATSNEVTASATHYYSVNDGSYQTTNYDNKGAKGGMSLAAGAGSTANGTASSVTGAFSRIDGNGANGMTSGFQGATASAYGSFNVIGAKSGVDFDGVANSVIGVANKTENANAALVFGAGNKVTNSYRPVDMSTAAPLASALQKAITTGDTDDMITALGGMVQTSGGAVLAIGGANTVDYALLSKVVGVGNTLTGTEGNESKLNMIDGFANKGTNVNNVTVIGSGNTVTNTNGTIILGDNRNLTGASNGVIIGSADSAMAATVADATAIGHNANVAIANGVALGSGSVASVDKGVAGYNPSSKALSGTAWTSTLAAVSVGDSEKSLTRQITNVAAGKEDTDAVNVAQLKANKVTVAEGTNVTVTPTTANDGSTTYTVAAKDTYTTGGSYDATSKKITFTQNDTAKNYEVDLSGLVSGITEDIDKGLNFAGDSGAAINKKLDQTIDIIGGAQGDLTTGNIGVISENGKLNVRLAKDLNDLNSVRVGSSVEGQGIYIANQDVKSTKDGVVLKKGNYITGLDNTTWNPEAGGYVSGRAATEDQLNSVYETINKNITANKAVSGKNITVDKDNKVNLNDEITLGDAASNNIAISGTSGTITAGDGGSNQVAIDGTKSTITAGSGDGKVTVDGNNGLVTVGDTTKGAISIGNQTVTPKVVGSDGTETDGTAKTGKYITGLENTTWNPTGEGYVADRAATEGQ